MFGIHNHKKEYASLMTGQLLAWYKKTGEEQYKKEYIRRLRYIGFSKDQAETLFDHELKSLTEYSVNVLTGQGYIDSAYFDLKNVLLASDYQSYIDHNMFTVSEIAKICDEAAWHAANTFSGDDAAEAPDDVISEIRALGGYGSDTLLVKYLSSISEKTGIPYDLIQRYSVEEQNLLFLYKWNDDDLDDHPYGALK